METSAAELESPLDGVALSAARQCFHDANTCMGAIGRCAGTTRAALPLLEEASYYAARQYNWMGFAIAGELASAGLWAYQVQRQREDRERGLSL
jgi:hypothetical protein